MAAALAARAARIVRPALVEVCRLQSKSGLADALVCGGSVASAAADCIRGVCSACGFKRFWSPELRSLIVDPSSHVVRGDAHQLWSSPIKWERLKSGDASKPGGSQQRSNDDNAKDVLRLQRSGTPMELLDEFLKVAIKYPFHRMAILNQKQACASRADL
eukprot:6213900-Pleurochrysis_carterae.AAC.1